MNTGLENRLCAYLQGVKDALPIAVVLVGGWAALRVAPMLSAVGSGGGPAPVPAVSPWDRSLLGQRIHLPQTDLNGRPVAIREGTVVVSVSCTDCASPEALLSIVSASPVKPVVLVSGNFTEPYRTVFQAEPGVRLVQSSPQSPVVPPEMLLKAPQAVVVDAKGVVVGLPREDETLKAFFELLGERE